MLKLYLTYWAWWFNMPDTYTVHCTQDYIIAGTGVAAALGMFIWAASNDESFACALGMSGMVGVMVGLVVTFHPFLLAASATVGTLYGIYYAASLLGPKRRAMLRAERQKRQAARLAANQARQARIEADYAEVVKLISDV